MNYRIIAAFFAVLLFLSACSQPTEPASDQPDTEPPASIDDVPTEADAAAVGGAAAGAGGEAAGGECAEITLVTHDSYAISDGTLEKFTEETCIKVTQVGAGDAGELVAKAILTKDAPLGDVLFGIDNTFLARGLEGDIFQPYTSEKLGDVKPELLIDSTNSVTPISYGDVCVNYWTEAVEGDIPQNLDDLTKAQYKGQLVVQHPETSSPGFAFLLATIETYGEDGWEQYWQDLVANDVAVTAGWSDAYYGEFISGGGQRSMVVSYATSPPAEVIYADPPVDKAPTGVIEHGCFRQIEFAGVLKGSTNAAAAGQFIDYMLSETYQADIAPNMFVYPAVSSTELPAEFVQWSPQVKDPVMIEPADIEANRAKWTERWVEIVLN